MKSSNQLQHRTGRPRSEKSHHAILKAAQEILIKDGLQGITMEGVAALAGVGKTTIYRRWKTKEDLIAEVLESISNDVEIPDSGSTLADLQALTENLSRSVNAIYGISLPPVIKILIGIVENTQLMEVYRRHFILPRRNALIFILERGKSRGEIRSEVNTGTIVDMIVGAYFYSTVIFPNSPTSSNSLSEVVTLLMKGIALEQG